MPSRATHVRIAFLLGIFALCALTPLFSPPVVGSAQELRTDGGSGKIISDFEARLTLARLLSYRSDQLDEAIHEYRILLRERPKDPRVGTELAQLLIRRKEYAEAVQHLKTVLELKPQDPAALTALARVYLWTGRNEDAARLFGHLSKLHTLAPDVLMDMARAYARNKEYDKAVQVYETLLKNKRAPHGEIYTELGDVRLYAGHFPQAIESYRKALEIDPHASIAQRQLALALSWSDQSEEALPLLTKLYQSDPTDKEIAVALARTYAASGRAMEAASMVRSLTTLYPEDGDLVAELADLEAGAGHAGKCRELYLKALALTEQKEALLLRYAAQMNLWGDFYKVESIYRDYLAVHPLDVEVSIKLAWLLVSAQRHEEAEGMYLKLLRQGSQREKVLLDLARLKFLEKDFVASLMHVERLLTADPHHPEGLFLKGEALFQAGRYGEALPVYKLLAEVEPKKARGALAVGKTYLKRGQPEEARAYLATARQIDPRNVEARFWMAGQEKAASKEFLENLLKSGNESPSALVEWAQVYASLGYNPMALSCYEEALRQDPDHFPARMGLAEILAATHQYGPSGEILKALTEEFPGASKILITRARVLGWSKHYDQSIEVYERVCKLNPSDPVPRKEKARTAAWGKKMDAAVKVYEEAYRIPVDRTLASSLEAVVREAKEPQLTKLFEELRQTSEGGSIYQGYEAFYKNLAGISSRLSPEAEVNLEEVRLELLPSYKIQKAAFLESRSKWLAWNRKFTRAMDSYQDLIGFQPGNEEARFDYAQVECSLGLCDREAVTYGNLLAIDPLHPLAAMGMERQRIRSGPFVELSHSYWNEEGRGGLSQITRNHTDVKVDVPLSCRYHMSLAANHWLEDPKVNGVSYDAYGPTLGFSGVLNEYVTGAVSWTNKQYTQSGVSSTNTGFGHLWFNLEDYARLGVGYDRTDELYNLFGVKQALQADSFWVGASSYLTRNLEVKGKAQYTNYNDGNAGQLYSMSAGYGFTDHPRILKLTLSGEYRDTEHGNSFQYQGSQLMDITHPYWAPRNYFATAALLEWYHDLSKNFFCGGELHSYALRVGVGTDTDDNPSVRLEGEWHYEFSDHWTVEVKGLLHDSRQWDATGAWMTLKYQF